MSLFYFGHLNNWERLCTLGKGTFGRACDTSWQGGRDCSPGFPWVSQFVYLADCLWLWGRGCDVSLLWSPHFLPSQNEERLLAAVAFWQVEFGASSSPASSVGLWSIWTFKRFSSKDTPPGLPNKETGLSGGLVLLGRLADFALQLILSYPAGRIPITPK